MDSRADLSGFEGVPVDHTSGSYSFVWAGRLFQLVAKFAKSPSDELLAEANDVLRTLAVDGGRISR